MEVILLSQNPEFLNECAELLNEQWKRSSSARVQSLEKSVTQLPDSLLLIETTETGRQVIGHSRLTRVLEDPYGCWIGSVVIKEDKRKKGYGKYLMQKTETYAKSLQFLTAYLNTHDQQGFYEHLGYIYCEPVSSISFTSNGFFTKKIVNAITSDYQNKNNLKQDVYNENNSNQYNLYPPENTSSPSLFPPPPPPPPPPPQSSSKISNRNCCLKTSLGQYWMKKDL